MINAGVGRTSDPKNLPQSFFIDTFIYYFQILMETARVVHNHPSGNPQPSRADIQITNKIAEAGRLMGIVVHDHIIIGSEGHTSLKAKGLI